MRISMFGLFSCKRKEMLISILQKLDSATQHFYRNMRKYLQTDVQHAGSLLKKLIKPREVQIIIMRQLIK